MKRQKIRRIITIITLLLFPIIIWYLSPYLIMGGASQGIISGSFIVFGCMLVLSVFFERAFCGWICPMGGLQDCMDTVNEKRPKQGWRNNIKYVVWIFWVGAIAAIFISGKNETRIDFFFMTDHGISISKITDYVVYYGVILIVFLMDIILGKRAMCHYLCWMAPFMVIGTKIREALHLPGIHIEKEESNCISCGKCNQVCPMSVDVKNHEDGAKWSSECIQCGACVDNCSKHVLHYALKDSNKGRHK